MQPCSNAAARRVRNRLAPLKRIVIRKPPDGRVAGLRVWQVTPVVDAAMSQDETVCRNGASGIRRRFSKRLKRGQLRRSRYGPCPANTPYVVRIKASKGAKLALPENVKCASKTGVGLILASSCDWSGKDSRRFMRTPCQTFGAWRFERRFPAPCSSTV